MPSTVDGKGEPILDSVKAIADLVVYGKIMKVMILPNDYNIAINMNREDCRRKLDRAHYSISCLLNF